MNGRPLGKRQTVRLLVGLTILAWATQTLLHQWGFGAEVPAALPQPPAERFVPTDARSARVATLELRAESTVVGAEVRLKQVCRWSNADAPAFAQVGELVMTHFDGRTPFKTVSLDEIRQTLHDAGVNLAVIRFAGPTSCTVNRTDVDYSEGNALQQWIAARETGPAGGAAPATRPIAPFVAERPAVARPVAMPNKAVAQAPAEGSPVQTLKDLLLADLAVRVSLPVTDLQVNFNPADQKLLSLSEPTFKFNINAHYIRDLGEVGWDVLIVTEAGTKKATVNATARAWQKQVVLLKPMSVKQIVQPTDVTERRSLVDHLNDEPLLNLAQVVGQQAARDLKPGTVVGSRMIDPVPLARPGQFVTVTLQQGSVRIKTVVQALEGGSYGQSIRVRNESTRETYEVVLTGPQEATLGPAAGGPTAGGPIAGAPTTGGPKVAAVDSN